jgi:sugar phosphate isomerase/epimerase
MRREQIFVATMADDFKETIAKYGVGVEIDHFCTAVNMEDPQFSKLDGEVRDALTGTEKAYFHAPFNELHPAAIDPLALELAYKRLEQAYQLARLYDICHMVVHSGYLPFVHFKEWHLDRSLEFWSRFMKDKPESFHIYIENVLEDEPYMLADLLSGLKRNNIHCCLDMGHANCMSEVPLEEWVSVLAPFTSHVHLHNNDGSYDYHQPPGKGTGNVEKAVEILEGEDTSITYTLECSNSLEGFTWLEESGFLTIPIIESRGG